MLVGLSKWLKQNNSKIIKLNRVKNPNWMETNQLAIYTSEVEDLNSGLTNKSSNRSGQDLNTGPSNNIIGSWKSSALTARQVETIIFIDCFKWIIKSIIFSLDWNADCEKTVVISWRHHWFPYKMMSEEWGQNFHTDDSVLTWSGWWFWEVKNLLHLIRST